MIYYLVDLCNISNTGEVEIVKYFNTTLENKAIEEYTKLSHDFRFHPTYYVTLSKRNEEGNIDLIRDSRVYKEEVYAPQRNR